MTRIFSSRPIMVAAVVVPAVAGVGGYGAMRAGASVALAAHGSAPVTGAWVYKDALTVETLHLKVTSKGVVSGTGSSTVKSTKNASKYGQFTIDVHEGRLRNNTLTLSLYVQQQFGNYYTAVENLSCAPTPRVLHCRMSTQILNKTYSNIRKDFYHK